MKPLIVLGFVFLVALSACKNHPEVQPVTVGAITPTSGPAGTSVTITGANFGSDKSIVKVVFGSNKEATIESVSSTEIKVTAPTESTSGPISVSVGEQSIQTSPFTFYTMYLYGGYGDNGATTYRATYWKDGNPTAISTTRAEIVDIAIAGNDIHALGFEVPRDGVLYRSVYWKNRVVVTVPAFQTFFTGIAVSGSDVYICGFLNKTPNSTGIVKYWKNGQEFILDESQNATAHDIKVVNGDVYICGAVDNTAAYWKNGVRTLLTDGNQARAITVKGNDVYVAGTQYRQAGNYAMYWKNGVSTTLTVPDNNDDTKENELALSIDVINGDVYVGGGVTILNKLADNRYIPKYWKNGTAVNVRMETYTNLHVLCVSVLGDDVFTTLSYNEINNPSYVFRNTEPILSSPGFSTKLSGHLIVTY